MTKTELLTELRILIDDTVEPYKASNARCLNWLSEGQDKFCAQTGFWIDKRTFTILTVLDQQAYVIDPRIISIRSIWDGTRALIDGEPVGYDDTSFADVSDQRPTYYRTDVETGYITFLEPVIAGVTLTIKAHRRALVALSASTGQPEIPGQFHLALAEYGAYKAFGDHDRELQDPVKAGDHYANFKAYVKDGARAFRRLTGEYADVVPNPLYVV